MKTPPRLAERFFIWASGQAQNEDLLGDLHELFEDTLESKGLLRAQISYWFQVIRLSFSYAMSKRKRDSSLSDYYTSQKFNTMIFSYIKISFRNIKKQKLFTALNVFGLALGMSVGILALAVFSDLKLFDIFHEDADQIYRITTETSNAGSKNHFASSPPALAEFLKENESAITESVAINDYFFPQIETVGEPIQMHGYYTESSFFDMFSFEFLHGDKSALNDPKSVIITYELAEKLFNTTDVMGRTIKTEDHGSFEVGAVLLPFPKHTHLKFDLLANIDLAESRSIIGSAGWTDFYSNYYYFKSTLPENELTSIVNTAGNSGKAFFDQESTEATYYAQSILEINPGPNYDDGIGVLFDKTGLWYFIGVSLMVLLPACFNYVNMAIANTINRTREIGIRKIIGSPNNFIIKQFLVETIIISLMAVLLSSVLFSYIKDAFTASLVGAEALNLGITIPVILRFLGMAILTGLLTGIIPALYLSRIAPISALSNQVSSKSVSISTFRKGLLVFQFVLSLSFMIGIGVVIRQYTHTLQYDAGFAKDNRIIIPISSGDSELLANELSTVNGVKSMSFSSSIPGLRLTQANYFFSNDGTDSVRTKEVFVSEHFIEEQHIEMLWGKDELTEMDFEQVLVNEKLLSMLNNIENDPKDSLVRQLGNEQVLIVGIIKDYNHEPLNESIEAMVMRLDKNEFNYAIIEYSGSDKEATMARIETAWKALLPFTPFKPKFLTTFIEQSYDFMFTAMKIFGFLALVSITISCLGLLGMVIYSTENRKKEVAIRKTLGANSISLFGNLSGTFLKLWMIALLIAMPSAYLFYDHLFVNIYNKFSEGVHVGEVLVSSLLTLSIGLLAIFWQSNRIIKMNPATNLRNE